MSRTTHINADPESAQARRGLDKARHAAKRALEKLRRTGSREDNDAFVVANNRAIAAYEHFKKLAFGGEE